MNQQTQKTSTKKARKSSQHQITVGIDLGDKWSHYCILDEEANVVWPGNPHPWHSRWMSTAAWVRHHGGDDQNPESPSNLC